MKRELPEEPGLNALGNWAQSNGGQAPEPNLIQRIEDLPCLEKIDTDGVEWVVDGLIAQGALHMITGEAGAGKSTLTSALGFAVSMGSEVVGRATSKRPVLILDAENPVSAVGERFHRLGIHTHDAFHVWGQWIGEDPPSAGAAIVLEWVARCDPKPVIIIDSLIAFHPGAENDSTETRKYLTQYRKLASSGATLILLHHIGKAETARDYRGSSDIKAVIDIGFKLTDLGDGSRLSILQLKPFKQRFSVSPALTLRYEEGRGFAADNSDSHKTVTERLVDLLVANPGIGSKEFEILAAERNLGRNRGREFLAEGVKHGSVRLEPGTKNQRLHFWAGANAGFSFGEPAG